MDPQAKRGIALVAGGLAVFGATLALVSNGKTSGLDGGTHEARAFPGNRHQQDTHLGELEDGGWAKICACTSGVDCEWAAPVFRSPDTEWKPAPKGVTFYPGGFRGLGCVAKICAEPMGQHSWPAGCPPE